MLTSSPLAPWFTELLSFMQQGKLAPWAEQLPAQLNAVLHDKEHGDQARWLAALQQLPDIEAVQADLRASNLALSSTQVTAAQQIQLEQALLGLMPWRKGPFQFFDTLIDTEWHSDWKWERVRPHLRSLQGRVVLDVGCGSGYHLWRMLGEGARRAIGVDPSRLFLLQFQAYKKYLQASGQRADADLLPLKMEDVPPQLKAFDTVFSMGVLYHRKSPLEHLQELKDALCDGGELVLETLVVEGDSTRVLMPSDRYAQMRNVWFLPSVEMLVLWCQRIGFKQVRVVDVTPTLVTEQRQTDWMRFNSLADFLDPNDPSKTIEGYPAPLRAVLVAEA